LGWAICSYVIIGAFIDGGALSVRLAHQRVQSHNTLHFRLLYEVHAIGALTPFLPILVVIAAVVAFRRKDPSILAPVAVLGGALGFDMLSYMSNAIDNELRYWIAVIPLGILLLGSLVVAIQTPRPNQIAGPVPNRLSRAGVRILGVFAALCLVLVVMIPTAAFTGSGMLNPQIGSEESQQIGFVFKPELKTNHGQVYPFTQTAIRYFEGHHLPNEDVVVDNGDATGCVAQMVVRSNQPKLFVIPNNRDFQRVLADPPTFHDHYILEADPTTAPVAATNILYPALWKDGAGFSEKVHTFPALGQCPEFRLFKVTKHPNQAH